MRPMIACALLFAPVYAQDPKLEHARRVGLERANALPNFVVDEVTRRYHTKHTDAPQWKLFDTIEAEVSIKGSKWIREHYVRDGKPWKKPDLSDFSWGMPFLYGLHALFDAKCPTMFEAQGRDASNG